MCYHCWKFRVFELLVSLLELQIHHENLTKTVHLLCLCTLWQEQVHFLVPLFDVFLIVYNQFLWKTGDIFSGSATSISLVIMKVLQQMWRSIPIVHIKLVSFVFSKGKNIRFTRFSVLDHSVSLFISRPV